MTRATAAKQEERQYYKFAFIDCANEQSHARNYRQISNDAAEYVKYGGEAGVPINRI